MILRRVIEHVKKQEWTAIALDFVIVVMGVFIGIQVANWNDARIERRIQTSILERLVTDFRSIESEALDALKIADSRMKMLDELAQSLSADRAAIADVANIEKLLWGLTIKSPVRGSATYEELLSAGRLDLLSSSDLRDALSVYARNREYHLAANARTAVTATAGSPHLVQLGGIASPYRQALFADAQSERAALLRAELLSLADETAFVRELMSVRGGQESLAFYHDRALNDARLVLQRLGQDVTPPKSFNPAPPQERSE